MSIPNPVKGKGGYILAAMLGALAALGVAAVLVALFPNSRAKVMAWFKPLDAPKPAAGGAQQGS